MKSMQQRSEETQAHILSAALALFSKNGYDATGVAEICQAAGVSKGAFYHHFVSKQAVFQTLLENWLAVLDTKIEGLLAGAPDVPTGLLHLAEVLGPLFQDARGQLPMFLEFWTHSSRDPALWATAIAPYQRFQALFTGILDRGVAEGTLRPMDTQLAARTLMALAIGMILQEMMDPLGAEWDQVAWQSIQSLISSFLQRDL